MCSMRDMIMFIETVKDVDGIFTKKRYFWNVIRPRDFYKTIAFWISQLAQSSDNLHLIEKIISDILQSTKSYKIRRSFIWGIMKEVPLLTIDTIRYANPAKITSLISSDKIILTDEYIEPFLKYIVELRKSNDQFLSYMELEQEVGE